VQARLCDISKARPVGCPIGHGLLKEDLGSLAIRHSGTVVVDTIS
jgi:hypothetical protein